MLGCKGAEDAVIASASDDAHTHHTTTTIVYEHNTLRRLCILVTLSLSWCDVCVCSTTGCGDDCLLGDKIILHHRLKFQDHIFSITSTLNLR